MQLIRQGRRPCQFLNPPELQGNPLLSLLAPLVRTPRAATRLFNVYGLLRLARNLVRN